MTKKKILFKNISLFLCLVPMLFLSLFCLVPNKQDLKVSALGDQVITNFNFVGSNVIVPVTMQVMGSGAFDRQTFANLILSFGVLDGVYSASVYGYVNEPNLTHTFDVSGVLNHVDNAEDSVERTNFLNVYVSGRETWGYKIIVFHSGQLTSDIIKVSYSHYENLMPSVVRPANYYNTITYYDSNGEFIEFQFPLYSIGQTLVNKYLFTSRTYYFTTSFSDNTYYQAGYEDGYDDGVSEGKDLGYKDGYNAGENIGYGNGYNDGVEHGGDYTFLGLMGAVVDVPISAFTSLLNFELLGFDMLAFVTGLLTLSLIIFVVKLILGGK